MDLLPNRDTVAAFEERLGKRRMSVLIWLLAIALAVASLGIIITAVRKTFEALQPIVPSAAWSKWADWAFRVVVVALYAVGFWLIRQRVHKLEKRTDTDNALLSLNSKITDLQTELHHLTEADLKDLKGFVTDLVCIPLERT